MDAQGIATILGAGGGAAIIGAFITGLFKWLSGASGRERVKNSNLLKRARDAEAEREAADDKWMLAREEIGLLRAQLRELGHVPKKLNDETETSK